MGLWNALRGAEVLDLAHEIRRGMPVSPNHPAFQLAMLRRHGDVMRPDGSSAANEVIVTGGHVGTHVDALAHVSYNGRLHGGVVATEVTSHEGFSVHGIDQFQPLVCRGVLLDIAATKGMDVLPAGYEVTIHDLEAAEKSALVEVGEGDAVLIRTGWSAHYGDPARFLGQVGGAPGPGADAGTWLADRKVSVTGAETVAYEVIPPGSGHALLPVHRLLLVEAGINIIEVMDLRALAHAETSEFVFVLAPLKIVGATGSPVRPLALFEGAL